MLRAQVAELETETVELAAHVAEQAEKIARLERLPEARAETTQYDRHEVQCSCGECTSRLPRRRRASRERSATG